MFLLQEAERVLCVRLLVMYADKSMQSEQMCVVERKRRASWTAASFMLIVWVGRSKEQPVHVIYDPPKSRTNLRDIILSSEEAFDKVRSFVHVKPTHDCHSLGRMSRNKSTF